MAVGVSDLDDAVALCRFYRTGTNIICEYTVILENNRMIIILEKSYEYNN
jgi:hypothetical protein